MGYNPWGHKESNLTERLTLLVLRFFHFRLLGIIEGKVGGEENLGLVNPAGLSNPCKMVL